MAGADVTAVIEAVLKSDQFTAGVESLVKESKSLEEKSGNIFKTIQEKVEKNFLAIKGAGMEAFESLKKGFEAAEISAKFEETAAAMKEQFGVAADEVLEKMGKASKGMISDTKLVSLASRAMALGVTNDVDTLAEMMQFADAKGKTLGKSMEEVFMQMAEGIGKQNPRILKELGFSAAAFKDMENGAVGVMSKTEMLGVVMGTVTPFVKKYGDGVLSAADKMEQIKASIENAKKSLGDSLVPALSGVMPYIQGAIKSFVMLPGPIKAASVGIMALVPALFALYAAAGPVGLALGAISAVAILLAGDYGKLQNAQEQLKKSNDELADSIYNSIVPEGERLRLHQQTKKAVMESGQTEEQYTRLIEYAASKVEELNKKMEVQKNSLRSAQNATGSAGIAALAYGNEIAKNVKELERFKGMIDGAKEKIEILAKAKSDAAKKEIQTQTDINKLIENYDKKGFDSKIELITEYLKHVEAGGQRELVLKKMLSDELKTQSELNIKISEDYYSYIQEAEKAQTAKAEGERKKQLDGIKSLYQSGYITKQEADARTARTEVAFQKQLSKIKIDAAKEVADKINQIVDQAAKISYNLVKLGQLKEQQAYQETVDKLRELEDTQANIQRGRREEDYADNLAKLTQEYNDAVAAGDMTLAKEKERSIIRLNQDHDYAVQKDALEQDAAKKERKLKHDAAVADKIIKLASAGISVSQAVIGGAAALPIPPFPFAIAAGALGATELALIAAQEIPALASGGVSAGGLSLVGEKGPELRILGRGDTIIPADKTARMLANLPSATNNSSSYNDARSVTTKNDNRVFSLTAHGIQDPMKFINDAKRKLGTDVFVRK